MFDEGAILCNPRVGASQYSLTDKPDCTDLDPLPGDAFAITADSVDRRGVGIRRRDYARAGLPIIRHFPRYPNATGVSHRFTHQAIAVRPMRLHPSTAPREDHVAVVIRIVRLEMTYRAFRIRTGQCRPACYECARKEKNRP